MDAAAIIIGGIAGGVVGALAVVIVWASLFAAARCDDAEEKAGRGRRS